MVLPRSSSLVVYVSDTRTRRLAAAAILGVAFALLNFVLDHSVIAAHTTPSVHSAIDSATMGIVAGVLVLLILVSTHSRRVALANELARVAALNHSLRNSLEVIVDSHYAKDEPHSKLMIETAEQLSQRLRELFPVSGAERRSARRR